MGSERGGLGEGTWEVIRHPLIIANLRVVGEELEYIDGHVVRDRSQVPNVEVDVDSG